MRKLIPGLLAALLTASLVACGASSTPTPTPTPIPTATPTTAVAATTTTTAAGLLTTVGPAMASVKSFHFTVEETATGLTGEGDVIPPDNVSVTLQLLGTSIPIIQTGGKTYIANPLTGQWEVQPTGTAAQAGQQINPVEALTTLNAATNVQPAGSETIDGVDTNRFTFSVDPSKVQNLPTLPGVTEDQIKNIKIDGEVWIGKQDNLVRQLVLDEDLSSIMGALGTPATGALGTPVPGTTPATGLLGSFSKLHEVIKFSKYNEPVEIKPPM